MYAVAHTIIAIISRELYESVILLLYECMKIQPEIERERGWKGGELTY